MLNRFATAVAALAAAVLALAAPAAAQRDVPQGFYGVNWDAEVAERAPHSVQDEEYGMQASAGVESTRTVFSWNKAVPQEGAPPDWSLIDATVSRAARHGIDLLPVVIEAPRWARLHPTRYHSPPRDPRDLARFFGELIARYGENGTFWTLNPTVPKRPLRTWQVWNEPHLRFQWDTTEDWRKTYGTQLRWAYKAIKKADPGAKVVLAGLSNKSWDYLAQAYRYGKVRRYFDVAAVHPYTQGAAGVIRIARKFRTVMRRNHDSRKALWITELGLPASKGKDSSKSPLQTTDEGMADYLTTSMEKLIAGRRSSNVRVSRVYWYNWASTYCCGDIFRYTGLRAYDPGSQRLQSKPAYAAFLDSAQRHEGCVKDETAACRP